MMQIDKIISIAFVLMLTAALGYIALLKSDIRSLEAKIDKEKSAKIIESQNLQQCSRELEALNERIDAERSDYEAKIRRYEATLRQKPKVRYKVIYQISKEKKSDECEDIKAVLDGVRSIPFDSLR